MGTDIKVNPEIRRLLRCSIILEKIANIFDSDYIRQSVEIVRALAEVMISTKDGQQ